jgi:predicted DCC family thiol-disulfide oxidoreductase YuxK
MANYTVIYDGECNLCSNLVQGLEARDRGKTFQYLPMQDLEGLRVYGISAQDCEAGMILIHEQDRSQRWQGSAAAEEIARIDALSRPLAELYRAVPGIKWLGDRLYVQIRDHRYALFGRRSHLYQSAYPVKQNAPDCETNCQL